MPIITFSPILARSQPAESTEWSPDLGTVTLIPQHQRTARNLRNHFQSLSLVEWGINVIDAELGKFEKLVRLDLTGNRINRLENLPDSVKVLNVYSNQISDLGTAPYVVSLQHLGVGFNRIYDLTALLTYHKDLVSIDLSCNNLVDISMVIAVLSQLRHLRHLVLLGNPLGLLQQYRPLICSSLSDLTALDGIDVEEHEQVVPYEVMEQRKQVMRMWQGVVFGEQMSMLKTMNERSKLRPPKEGEMTPQEIIENNAVQLIQHCWMGFQAVRQAKMKRKLMEDNVQERQVSLTVNVKAVTLQAPEPIEPPAPEAPPEEEGKGGKGGKKGKEEKKKKQKAPPKKGKDGNAAEGPWSLRAGVRFPPVKQSSAGSGAAQSDVLPRAPDVLLEECEDPTIRVNLVETVQFPVTVGLRDALMMEGCELELYDVFDFEKDPNQDAGGGGSGGDGPKAPLSAKVGSAMVKTSLLLDAAKHREADGRPRYALTLTVPVDRRGTAVAPFCRQEPLFVGEPGLEPGQVPLRETARVEVEVLLNVKTTNSPRPVPEE